MTKGTYTFYKLVGLIVLKFKKLHIIEFDKDFYFIKSMKTKMVNFYYKYIFILLFYNIHTY